MRSELIEKKAVEATVKVTVPATDVDATFERVVSELARQVRVPGFRPGRAPRGVVIKRFGEDALAEEVKDKLIDDHFRAAMEEHDLLPISTHFHAHAPVRGEDYSFEVHSELYPEVTLPDLEGLSIDAPRLEVTDEMVEEAVEELRRENATLVPVDRPVEATDWLMIEARSLPQAGTADGVDDGQAATGADADPREPSAEGDEAGTATGEGESGEATMGSSFPVDLERTADELKDQLIGATIGEEREVTLTDATEASASEDGAPGVRRMKVKVVDVKAKEKPEPGPELATQLGVDSWDDVLERIRSSIAADIERQVFEARREELVTKLMDGSSLELPPGMVRRRQQTLLENLAEDLQQRGETFASYVARLEARGKREEFEQELLEAAQRGVKRDLVLERLTEVRGTEVSQEELTEALRHLASQRRQDVGSFVRDMGEEWVSNYRYMIARDKAVRDLISELSPDVDAAPEG